MGDEQKRKKLFYTLSIIFLILCSICVAVDYRSLFLIAPFFLISYLLAYKLEYVFLLLAFLTPLSVELSEFSANSSFNIQLPTEIITFILMLVFFVKLAYLKGIKELVFFHPLSKIVLIYLLWYFISSATSSMPLVSFKHFIARGWYIVVFFYMGVLFFSNKVNATRYIWAFGAGLIIVVFYTLTDMWLNAGGLLNQKAAHSAMSPFFNDHTSYGATLALIIPPFIYLAFFRKQGRLNKNLSVIALSIFVGALVFSYSRAAWLSLVFAIIIGAVIILRIKLKYIFTFMLVASVVLISNFSEIERSLMRNKQDSSSNFSEHIKSIPNIKSDASNLERINRWKCSWRMFLKKPVFGYGPGTYMFNYAPFQRSSEKTIISTNSADGGNAHSEYLGKLSESGFLGLLTFLLVIISYIYYSIHIYYTHPDRDVANLILACFIGVVTYLFHAFLNNFLDIDKIAVPFWSFFSLTIASSTTMRTKIARSEPNI